MGWGISLYSRLYPLEAPQARFSDSVRQTRNLSYLFQNTCLSEIVKSTRGRLIIRIYRIDGIFTFVTKLRHFYDSVHATAAPPAQRRASFASISCSVATASATVTSQRRFIDIPRMETSCSHPNECHRQVTFQLEIIWILPTRSPILIKKLYNRSRHSYFVNTSAAIRGLLDVPDMRSATDSTKP